MRRTTHCDKCGCIYDTIICPACYMVKKRKPAMKFPMLNGQIDTDVLAEYILLKILLHIDSVVPRDKVKTMESELKDVLDQLIDNS